MALTGAKGKTRGPRGKGIPEQPSHGARPTRRAACRTASRRLGTRLDPATWRRRPPRGPPSPARSPPPATHLPSRPAPRPPRGSSPGAALPGGRRPRSGDPLHGRPRAPARPRRTRRRWRLLLLPPASPSWPAGGRRAPGPARPFSARRRQRRGSRGPGCGRGAGGEGGCGPRAQAPGVGLGRCVRGSERVSHSRGIAYEEPERRGRGSGTAGGHTGNGQGPRVPALASEGRGGAQGPAHSVPTPGRSAGLCVHRGVRELRPLVLPSGSHGLHQPDGPGRPTAPCRRCPAREEEGDRPRPARS